MKKNNIGKRMLAIVTAAVMTLGCVSIVSAKPESTVEPTAVIKKELNNSQNLKFSSEDGYDASIMKLGGMTPIGYGDISVNQICMHFNAQHKTAAKKAAFFFNLDTAEDTIVIKVKSKLIGAGDRYTAYACNGEPIWESRDVRVTKVDDGYVKLKVMAEGPVVLCRTRTGAKLQSLKMNKTTATVKKNKKLQLRVTAKPSNASGRTVTWSSSDKSIATVSKKGVVKAKKQGTVIITATSFDGSKKATCKVTVPGPVKAKSIRLNRTKATITEDHDLQLRATISPYNTAKKEVEWTSSDEDVAEVDEDGLVTAITPGFATITARTKDGSNKTAKCKITVRKAR